MVTMVLAPDPALPASILDDTTVARLAMALQAWIDRDVAPAWSQGPYRVIAVPRGATPPAGTDHRWLVHLSANSDVAGALGYHTLDAAGNPVAHVFVVDTVLLNRAPSTVVGHEMVEMMVNRWCSAAVLANAPGDPAAGLAAFTMEACDPCEVWSYDFIWEGERYAVPDFVLPTYFRPGAAGPYDHMGQVSAPLQPAKGCRQTYYIGSSATTILGQAASTSSHPRSQPDAPSPIRPQSSSAAMTPQCQASGDLLCAR
jgi:hypothetical protein